MIFSIFKKGVKFLSGHSLTRFYFIKVVYYFLLSHLRNSNSTVDVFNHKMFLDSIDTHGLSIRGVCEPFETELVKKEIKKGNIFLDRRANIGYYTLIFAELVGESGKVFAFEPDSTNFNILKRNIKLNGYQNIVPIQKAISNKTGKGKLYLSKYNRGAHMIYNLDGKREFIEIETIRLDDYFKEPANKMDFIKMDIEGAESQAIQGMTSILKKNKNLKIFTEFNPPILKRLNIEPKEFLNLFVKFGFKLYYINDREKKIKLIGVNKLIQECSDEYTNLLCIR